MNGMEHISLLGLVATDEQTREWMAAARTAETWARIRRWSKVETVAVLTMLTSLALLFVAPFASIPVPIWNYVTDVERTHLYW